MASKLYTFHPEIYPRTLWIQVGFDVPEGFDGVTVEDNDSAMAVVNKVYDKKSNKYGCMIRFENLKAIDLPNVTHESIHVAMDIFGFCGIEPDNNNQEPLCYLAGWVAKCCKEVLGEEYRKIQEPSQSSDFTELFHSLKEQKPINGQECMVIVPSDTLTIRFGEYIEDNDAFNVNGSICYADKWHECMKPYD